MKLGTGGKVTIYNNTGSVDVIVDVNGWFTDSSVARAAGALHAAETPARRLRQPDRCWRHGCSPGHRPGRGSGHGRAARSRAQRHRRHAPARGWLTAFPTGAGLASDIGPELHHRQDEVEASSSWRGVRARAARSTCSRRPAPKSSSMPGAGSPRELRGKGTFWSLGG